MRDMSNSPRPSVPKLPFFICDAIMLCLAGFVYSQSKIPLAPFSLGAICASVAIGAALAILPFVLEYRLALKLAEADSLTSAVAQINNLETLATQISQATGQWQTVHEHATKAVSAATDIGERMTQEAKAFAEFMQKANDSEKATLRVEVEKLRRAENDWLQVVVRMLDHTHALHAAAARSGKTSLIEQLTQFQNAQRDAARRIGLTPFTPTIGDGFDSTKHQSTEANKPEPGTPIGETVATGYTFRGQLIRPALVSMSQPKVEEPNPAPAPAEEPTLL